MHLVTTNQFLNCKRDVVLGMIEERRTNTNNKTAEAETRQGVFYEIGSSSAEQGSAGAVVFAVVT
jgi:hypothetical protein